VARYGLAPTLAAAALAATATACTLPEAPAREARTNADAAHGKPYPTLAPKQAGAPAIDVVAKDGAPQWERKTFTTKAGVSNISFSSPKGGNHNLNLVGPGAPYPLLWGEPAGAPEDHLTYAVNLVAGKYTFYCSVQGHRAAGMEGTITVE
jgi:plastocyanin